MPSAAAWLKRLKVAAEKRVKEGFKPMRIREGALSPLATPSAPPAKQKLERL